LVAAIILTFIFILISTVGVDSATAGSSKSKGGLPKTGMKDKATLWYVIGPEDVLDISVWKNPDLSRSVTVRPDGRISLPLIGDVKAAGLTPGALRESITKRLKEYQETVVVSVIVNEVNSYRIFILGEVARPGTYLMKRRTTVLQAIAIAGGFSQYASKNKMVVVRERVGADTAEERTPVRFDDLVKAGGKSEKNLILRPGDTIFVP
jgi:polysaccharide export outer membrane protein